jgi:acetyl-CoA carboxylase biotin carboxyl carrier protein
MTVALSHTDVRRILQILDSAQFLESLDLKLGEFELHARKAGAAPRAAAAVKGPDADVAKLEPVASAASTEPAAPLADQVPEGLVAVRSPMVGTFYLRPSPDQAPFVAVGSAVQPGDTVCLVEVMKMFNTVTAGVAGTVERIEADHGKPVRHNQIVMLIKPAQEG